MTFGDINLGEGVMDRFRLSPLECGRRRSGAWSGTDFGASDSASPCGVGDPLRSCGGVIDGYVDDGAGVSVGTVGGLALGGGVGAGFGEHVPMDVLSTSTLANNVIFAALANNAFEEVSAPGETAADTNAATVAIASPPLWLLGTRALLALRRRAESHLHRHRDGARGDASHHFPRRA